MLTKTEDIYKYIYIYIYTYIYVYIYLSIYRQYFVVIVYRPLNAEGIKV